MVDGCSTTARLQLVDAIPSMARYLRQSDKQKKSSSPVAGKACQPALEMNKGLLDFANRHLEGCVREGWNAHIESRPELG